MSMSPLAGLCFVLPGVSSEERPRAVSWGHADDMIELASFWMVSGII